MLDLHFALCLFTLPSFTLSALIMQSESVSKGVLRNVTANGFDGKGSKSFGQSEVQSTFEYPIYFLLFAHNFIIISSNTHTGILTQAHCYL